MSLLQIMRAIAQNHNDFRHEEPKPSGALRETFAFAHDGADLANAIANAGDYPILQYHPERGTIERSSDLTTKVLASFSIVRRGDFGDADAVSTAQKDNLRNGQQILILLENMQEDGEPTLSGFDMEGTRWEHSEIGSNNIVKTTFFLNLSHAGVSPYTYPDPLFPIPVNTGGGTYGRGGQLPNFSVQNGAAGSDVQVSGTYPNFSLTIPRGADGEDGEDAPLPKFTIQIGEPGTEASASGAYPDLVVTIPRATDGVDGEDGADAPLPNFSVQTGAAGSDVQVSGIYPDLTLTIPRGADGSTPQSPNFTVATGAAGSSATISGTYPNFTLTIPRGDTGPAASASVSPYSPAVSTNWNGSPTTVAAALDESASRIKTIEQDVAFATVNITDFTTGFFWRADGAISTGAGWKRTKRYRTVAGAKFNVPAGQSGFVQQAVFWDAAGNVILAVRNGPVLVTTPPNAYHVAFSVASAATEIKVGNRFWALQESDLLAEYTQTGNKEVNITSIDFATNTFTSPAHGLVNTLTAALTNRVAVAIKSTTGVIVPQNVIPFTTVQESGFYVVNATTNTFQLALSEGGDPVVLTNKTGLDLGLWHIEQGANHTVSFLGITEERIRTLVEGPVLLGYSYYIGAYAQGAPYYRDNVTVPASANLIGVGFPTLHCRIESTDVNAALNGTGSKIIQADGIKILGTGSIVTGTTVRQSMFTRAPWNQGVIGTRNMLLQNGTTIKIYKN